MKPQATERLVKQSGSIATGEFGISLADSAHIMTILRDTLYSDKVLAVLREYSSNAWDAHRDAGKGDVPIEVTLPTLSEPTLTIRDHGRGLSRDDVFRIYTQYGASTKRDTDDAVGMLGIGSKSGFAYADSFTITSFHSGIKSTYVAVLDESEKGIVSLVHEQPCGTETGVEIQVAIQRQDIEEFRRKAQALFKYFDPQPTTNVQVPKLPANQSRLKNGVIFHDANWETQGWVAVMGCVAYKIDLNHVMRFEEGLPDFVRSLSGALYFSIGDVTINASREELKYSNATKRAIIDRINALVEEYVKLILDDIETKASTPWDRRLACQVLQMFGDVVPKNILPMAVSYVRFDKTPTSFKVWSSDRDGAVSSIRVEPDIRLVIRDDTRAMKGFGFNPYRDYIVRREPNFSWDVAQPEFDKFLADLDLTGITIVKASELPWTQPPTTARVQNAKHRVKLFRWDPKLASFQPPYSDYWTIDDRVPTDEDVYVEIKGFEAIDTDIHIFSAHEEDVTICKFLGRTMPPIYGYKVTQKDPSKIRVGTSYGDWRKKLLDDLLASPLFMKEYQLWRWATASFNSHYFYYRSRDISKEDITALSASLGADHTVMKFIERKAMTSDDIKQNTIHSELMSNIVYRVRDVLKETTSEIGIEFAKIESLYPLLSIPDITVAAVCGPHRSKWIEYIKTLDAGRNNAIHVNP